MSKIKPGTVEKNSSTTGPPTRIEPTPSRCRNKLCSLSYGLWVTLSIGAIGGIHFQPNIRLKICLINNNLETMTVFPFGVSTTIVKRIT